MKKKLLLLTLAVFVCVTGFAQNKTENLADTTPFQLQGVTGLGRKMIINQHEKLLAKNKKEFGDHDPTFARNTIPDKWKNESAVIIGRKSEYDYYTSGSAMSGGVAASCDEVIRVKIMLLDKSAIDKFSTMTFYPYQEVGFRIIKKDGTIKNINTLNAVPVDSKERFNSMIMYIPIHTTIAVPQYYKLAIPGLEPGDIFEYYYVNTATYTQAYVPGSSIQMYRYGIPFPKMMFTLNDEYPIMKQRWEYNIQKGFYLNYTATNGAPKFSQSEVVDKHTKLFAINDTNREKQSNELWKYDFRSDPTINIQVVWTSESGKDEMPYMLGQPFVPTTKVPHDLLQGVADQIAMEKMDAATKVADDVVSYMHKHYKKLNDSVEYMRRAYYFLRYYMFVKKRKQYERGDYDPNSIADVDIKNIGPDEPTDRMLDELFIKVMGRVAREAGVEYKLVFGVPRTRGSLENLIMRDDMQWLMKINGVNDMYLYPPTGFSNPDEPMSTMDGDAVYTIIPNNNDKKVIMDESAISMSPSTANMASYTVNASLGSAMEGSVAVTRNVAIKGLLKSSYYPDALIQDEYEDIEAAKYGDETEADYINHLSAKKKSAEIQDYNQFMADEESKRKDAMKSSVGDEYNLDSYDDFKLVNSGIEMDSTTLMFNEKFKVKDLVKKVGPNYTVQVGQLIGKQVELDKYDSVRKSDVYLSCAHEMDYEVDFNIPSGYKVDGVNALNMNVSNATGGFISTASVNGNTLVIKTRKYYAANYQPVEKWPDMKQFLQAAYDFTQKKILLKKA
jgi:hypothetical protein